MLNARAVALTRTLLRPGGHEKLPLSPAFDDLVEQLVDTSLDDDDLVESNNQQ